MYWKGFFNNSYSFFLESFSNPIYTLSIHPLSYGRTNNSTAPFVFSNHLPSFILQLKTNLTAIARNWHRLSWKEGRKGKTYSHSRKLRITPCFECIERTNNSTTPFIFLLRSFYIFPIYSPLDDANAVDIKGGKEKNVGGNIYNPYLVSIYHGSKPLSPLFHGHRVYQYDLYASRSPPP